MVTRSVAATVLALTMTTSAYAQQPTPAIRSTTTSQTPKSSAPSAPVETPGTPRPAPEPQGQPVNLRLELTISDQGGSGEPIKKTVSAIVADRANGYIRSSTGPARLNVDITPTIVQGGNVRLRIGLEYMPRPASGENVSSLNEAVVVVLEPGKPLVISQAADPLSERKVTVEVRISLVK